MPSVLFHKGCLYLLHFAERYYHARHYLGWAYNRVYAERRVAQHKRGAGSPLVRAVWEAGIQIDCVLYCPGTRLLERGWKDESHLWRRCPVCCAARGVACSVPSFAERKVIDVG